MRNYDGHLDIEWALHMSHAPLTPTASHPAAVGAPGRKPTSLSLAPGLVAEARALGVNVSQAAEVGIAGDVPDSVDRVS